MGHNFAAAYRLVTDLAAIFLLNLSLWGWVDFTHPLDGSYQFSVVYWLDRGATDCLDCALARFSGFFKNYQRGFWDFSRCSAFPIGLRTWSSRLRLIWTWRNLINRIFVETVVNIRTFVSLSNNFQALAQLTPDWSWAAWILYQAWRTVAACVGSWIRLRAVHWVFTAHEIVNSDNFNLRSGMMWDLSLWISA